MNLVDSSGWLEYFANGPNAGIFAPPIEDVEDLPVPTICLLEVFKRVLQQRGEDVALEAVALMMQGRVLELNTEIALNAARLGHSLKMALADAVVLATARKYEATVWTQDSDFEDTEGVRYVKKVKTGRA